MKRFLFLGLAASVLFAGAASANELKVAVANLPPYLDPGKDFSNTGSQMYYNSFDPLIEKDYADPRGKFKPGLASSWKQASPTEFDVTLRQGVKFHDGEAMTAGDVVFTFERILKDMTPEFAAIHREFFSNFKEVVAVDDKTVRFTTFKPEPLFETLLNASEGSIVPEKYIAGLTGDPQKVEPSDFDAFALKPVGTGPYAITAYQPGETLTYTRFDGFWGEKPLYDKVVVRRISELATRVTALANGEADLITNVPPDQIDTINATPSLKVVGSVTPLFHVVFFNTRNPEMANKHLRRALVMSINRKLLNEALWGGKAVVPSTHTYPQYGDLYMPDLKTFGYDLAKAKEEMKQANYDGKPIRFDTDPVYYTNGLLAAQAIKEMWAEIGVKMDINVTTKWTGRDPDMEVRNWSNPMYFADPAGSYGVMWAPGGSGSEMAWPMGADYAKVWDEFRYSTDVAARQAAYAKLMDYVKDEAPFLVLYQPYESYGMRKTLDWTPLPGHIPYVLDFRAGAIATH